MRTILLILVALVVYGSLFYLITLCVIAEIKHQAKQRKPERGNHLRIVRAEEEITLDEHEMAIR